MVRAVAYFLLSVLLLCQCKSENNTNIDVNDIISQMTLDEKIDFIGGYNEFYIRGYEHLNIPEIKMADGPVGVRNYGASTAYPASIALAATWNKELAYKYGKALASEARTKNVQMMLGPGMNICRMPICGRNFEYLGEDPYLAGHIAASYIEGIQDLGVMATAKHYVANNQEYSRHHVSSDMDERTLHEIYLPAFKTCVQEANVASVMTSYNPINGVHASENNYLINDVLKDNWGFDGFVVSDWGSTYDGVACAKGGLDLEMPSAFVMNKDTLLPAIANGELDETVIDDKIRRILNVYKQFDFFNHPNLSVGFELDSVFVKKVAVDVAKEGIVLLKNENSFLPINKKKYKSVVIVGPNGNSAITGGGGSSIVTPNHKTTLYKEVKRIAGDDANITFQPGVYTSFDIPDNIFDDFDFYIYQNNKKMQGVEAVYYNGHELEGDPIYATHYDRLDLNDSDFTAIERLPLDHFSARFTCYYTPEESAYYSIAACGDDGYRINVNGKRVVDIWLPQFATIRMSDVYMEAGKEYKIEVEYFENVRDAVIKLGLVKSALPGAPTDLKQMAIDAACNADAVIMAVGFNHTIEAEDCDRPFEMPYNQSDLINAVAKVNKNVVVVLNAGGNVEMASWIDNVKALLMAWYPGQEGAMAEAEMIYGLANPSGKLPVSFAKRIEDEPAFQSYYDDDNDKRVEYSEGIFIGYRGWDNRNIEPLFPFGYGLSYTQFDYSDLICDKSVYSVEDQVEISFKLKNLGRYQGSEVVQLYVSDRECSLPRPVKELKAFKKINLFSGEEVQIKFALSRDDFSFYNPSSHSWEVESGEFQILIGSSSKDIRLKQLISID